MRRLTKLGGMNRGRRLVLLVLSALVLGAEAQSNCAKSQFDGFYGGANLGYMNQNTSLDAKQDPANQNADRNNTSVARGVPTIEAVLGWGKVFLGCLYGGVEGKVDLVMGGAKKVAEDSGFAYKSGRKGTGVAVLGRLGFLINPTTMIYGGVGVKSVHFIYDLFEKADQISALFSKRSHNFLTEVGVETSLNPFQNVKFRFSYAFMPKKDLTRKTTQFPQNHMYQGHGVFKVGTSEHALKVGLICHF